MTRIYRKSLNYREVAVPDWQLIQGLAEAFSAYGPVTFQLEDNRGTYDEEGTVEAFRARVEQHNDPLESISLGVTRGYAGEADFIFARVTSSNVWRGVMFGAQGSDEAIINHLATRTGELVDSARERFVESAPPAPGDGFRVDRSRLRAFLYDPWTIGIGGSLVVSLVLLLIAWVAGLL